jgi:hypothetical protein
MMIPSPLTPNFGWLLRLTSKRWPPKAKTPSLSLIFDGSRFGAPSKRTSRGDRKPATGCLLCGPMGSRGTKIWGRQCPTHGERGQSRWRVEWRLLILMLWVVGCGLGVAGCGLWVLVWARERLYLRYPFCRPPRQTVPPKNNGDEMNPP